MNVSREKGDGQHRQKGNSLFHLAMRRSFYFSTITCFLLLLSRVYILLLGKISHTTSCLPTCHSKPQFHYQETISNQACTQYNIKLQHVAVYFMFKWIYSFHLSGNWNVPSHYYIVSFLKKRRMTSCTKNKNAVVDCGQHRAKLPSGDTISHIPLSIQ